MKTVRMSRGLVQGLALASLASLAAALAQEKPPAARNQPPPPPPPHAAIWPAGLESLAGEYQFVQVASPGGLWRRRTSRSGEGAGVTQVSLNEVPRALRDQLSAGEIVISKLRLPTQIEAHERISPTGRGNLRFYGEQTVGHLKLRNLPGVGGLVEDGGQFEGAVLLTLSHQSHSNPSISGIFQQRVRMEPTWGVAALDFADLTATAIDRGVGENADGEEPPEALVITNARVLRSGLELFAYVHWTHQEGDVESIYTGSVRLLRADAARRSAGGAPSVNALPGTPSPR